MIIQNAVVCNKCDDYIFSKTRHDFVTCSCGSISVDGGQHYLRRLGNRDDIVEMSWSLPDDVVKSCVQAVYDAKETNRTNAGIANAVFRSLREHNRIVAEDEMRVISENKIMDEILVEDSSGTILRYKKVI